MKILHIIFSMQTGGSETMLVDILNGQAMFNHSVELLIINEDYNSQLIDKIDKRVKTTFINRRKGSRNPFPILKYNKYIQNSKPDILHFHDHKAINLLFWRKSKKILTIHDMKLDSSNWKKFDVLCAISKSVQKDILERSGLKSELIYNGITLDKIIPKTDNSSKITKIIQIGRLDHFKKGQDILIKAIDIILKQQPDLDLSVDFIGEGPSLNYLKDIVSNLRLTEKIKFLGNKTRSFIYEHLKEYSLLVQPSIYEGFGLTVIEGIAAKLPILVSDNDGPIEIIENGEFGYSFEIGNVEECASAIMNIMKKNKDEIEEITEKAYNHVSSNFDIKKTVQEYLNLYSK